jgi:hypothetical protein
MAGTRANWHLADLDLDDSDPLDIRTVAKPIDVRGDVAALQRELAASLRIENRKAEQGIFCQLKLSEDWPTGYSCRTCPHRSEDPENPMAAICAMSMRQIDIIEEIGVLRMGSEEALGQALADAHGGWAAWEAQDLAAAHGDWAMADAVCV